MLGIGETKKNDEQLLHPEPHSQAVGVTMIYFPACLPTLDDVDNVSPPLWYYHHD